MGCPMPLADESRKALDKHTKTARRRGFLIGVLSGAALVCVVSGSLGYSLWMKWSDLSRLTRRPAVVDFMEDMFYTLPEEYARANRERTYRVLDGFTSAAIAEKISLERFAVVAAVVDSALMDRRISIDEFDRIVYRMSEQLPSALYDSQDLSDWSEDGIQPAWARRGN